MMNMLANHTSAIIRLNGQTLDKAAHKLLPEAAAKKNGAVPLWLQGNDLVVAFADPTDLEAIRQVESVCRRSVVPLKASAEDIHLALHQIYSGETIQPGVLDYGDILYNLGYLSEDELGTLRSLQAGSKKSALLLCQEHGLADPEKLAEAAGVFCGLPYFRLKGLEISGDLSALIPWEMATNRKVIPLLWFSGMLVVVSPDLQPGDHLDDVAEFLGLWVQPMLCSQPVWNHLYRRFYLRGRDDLYHKDAEIIEWLMKHNELPGLNMDAIQALALQTEDSLENILIGKGMCSRSMWMRAKSELFKIEPITEWKDHRTTNLPQTNLADYLPQVIAERFSVVPLSLQKDRLNIALSDPNPATIRLVAGLTGKSVHPYLLASEDIQQKLKDLYEYAPRRQPHFVPLLGDLLHKIGILTNEQLDEMLISMDGSNPALGKQLINAGYLDSTGLVEALSLQTGIPHIHLDHMRLLAAIAAQIPENIAEDHSLIPVWSSNTDLWIAMSDPFDAQAINKVEAITGKRVWVVLAPHEHILAALERLPGKKGRPASDRIVLNILQKLVEAGLLTQLGATQALREFEREQLSLDKAISNASHHSLDKIAKAVANIIGLPFVSLQLQEQMVSRVDPLGRFVDKNIILDPVDERAARLIGLEDARNLSALPISFNGEVVVAAFADPNYSKDLEELQKKILHQVTPVFAYRDDLDGAIQRVLGKRNIGNYLLMDGLITRGQLNNALDFAKDTGVRLGKALINRGFITEKQLYLYLAKQTSLPFYDLSTVEINRDVAQSLSARTAREYGILPILEDGANILVAVVDPFNTEALQAVKDLLGKEITPVLVTERDLENSLEGLFSRDYLSQSISELLERTPEDSAFKVLSIGQTIGIVLFVLISAFWIWFDFTSYIIVINSLATIFYIAFSSYKFYLVYRALSNNMEVPVAQEELQALNDRDLPVYTILVPVYKEADVLPELLGALKKLEYPTTKLDIQVLMEEDDEATIAAFNNWNPPSHFHGIVVPFGEPKTKPKACNYGLIHARGEYVVIFDAEDIPQPDQLKKIVVAFAKSPAQVACIQCKLNYYNSEQNLLTRWFTVEYSMWFDLFLPGLSASSAPIPLGGTSNHFKKDALVEIGAWDPYNVTEDADLGVRLFKRGYKTAIVESTTFEEANSQVRNWIRQRSRWIKGYIQTWLVHMRNPVRLFREIGLRGFLSFQFVVGGTFFAALINPIYWMLTTLWFLLEWKFIQVIFPGVIFFLGSLCLFVGNFVFTYMNVAGALRREQYGMVKVALISPIYWALASLAAWIGFIQLLYKPHFWEKTTHGLYTEAKKEDSTQHE